MIRKLRLSLAGVAAVLVVAASSASAQSKPDSLAFLKAQADSISAVLGRAILQQDSTKILAAVSDTVGVLMPGRKIVNGREKVAQYLHLLFQKWGGARLETKRTAIEKVPGYGSIARQAGTLSLTPADSTGTNWSGQYTVYWRFTDSSWTVERLFVAQR